MFVNVNMSTRYRVNDNNNHTELTHRSLIERFYTHGTQ